MKECKRLDRSSVSLTFHKEGDLSLRSQWTTWWCLIRARAEGICMVNWQMRMVEKPAKPLALISSYKLILRSSIAMILEVKVLSHLDDMVLSATCKRYASWEHDARNTNPSAKIVFISAKAWWWKHFLFLSARDVLVCTAHGSRCWGFTQATSGVSQQAWFGQSCYWLTQGLR